MIESNKKVLVVGTGTIGEPLIGLLTRLSKDLGIEEVSFYKRTPLVDEKPKVNSLVKSGAKLVVGEDDITQFEALGHKVDFTYEEALSRARVVIDCTPAGNINKKISYQKNTGKTYIAQGSEKGFGTPYALGISDEKLLSERPDYIQVVSCNTHAIARLLNTLTRGYVPRLIHGDFTCIRRANDVSQDSGFIPSVTCSRHDDEKFGTHHARDVNDLFNFRSSLPIFSSAIKSNTQYMHTVRFSLAIDEEISRDEVFRRLTEDRYISLTDKKSSNKIFSFGRDHGFYGRLYTQAVVSSPSLYVNNVSDVTRIAGVSFTPQDGNSLMSSMAACLFGLYGENYTNKLHLLHEMMINEV